jgi:GH25 family lysozyme M1 (1,4-beta-N-acetylmuramidase)
MLYERKTMTTIDYNTTEVRGMGAGRIPWTASLKNSLTAAVGVTARGPAIPPADRAIGFDTYSGNGVIDWNSLYVQGARFAIFKASQGTTIQDNQFKTSRTNIGTLMPWGCYHFLTNTSGSLQADYFCDFVLGNYGPMPPVLDVELSAVAGSVVRAFVTRLYQRLSIYPIIYTSAYFWEKVTGSTDKTWVSANCGLWVAHWKTLYPILPVGWTNYLIHQYDDNWNGVLIDPNYSRISWLAQFQGGHDSWGWQVKDALHRLGEEIDDPPDGL